MTSKTPTTMTPPYLAQLKRDAEALRKAAPA